MAQNDPGILRLGIDVGSTTVKAVALAPSDNSVLFTRYQRHNAHQAATVRQLLEEAAGRFPEGSIWSSAYLEPGRCHDPAATAKVLQCSTDYLLGLTDVKKPYPKSKI